MDWFVEFIILSVANSKDLCFSTIVSSSLKSFSSSLSSYFSIAFSTKSLSSSIDGSSSDTFAEYKEKMIEGQKEIYYAIGKDKESVLNLPFLST